MIPDGWFGRSGVSGFQTFLDQTIGQDQLGFRDPGQRQQHTLAPVFTLRFDHQFAILQSGDGALEPPAAVDWLFQLDPRFMPGKTFIVAGTGQRAIDTRRRDLEHIFIGNRISGFEHLGQLARKLRAIIDIHAAIGPLGHHLQRLSFAAHEAQAHEAIARCVNSRRKKRIKKIETAQCNSKSLPERRSYNRHTTAVVLSGMRDMYAFATANTSLDRFIRFAVTGVLTEFLSQKR